MLVLTTHAHASGASGADADMMAIDMATDVVTTDGNAATTGHW